MRIILMCFLSAYVFSQSLLVESGNVAEEGPGERFGGAYLVDTRVGVDPPAFAAVSSFFTDPPLGGFNTASADDFTVPDCGWEITKVRAFGNYQDTLMTGEAGPATSVQVYFIPKTGTIPTSTDLASIAVWAGQNLPFQELDLVDGGDFEIDIPSVVLPGGDYWLVVQANIELLAVGQWNWTESSLTPNSGTTFGDESAWFQSAAGVLSPITGMAECVGFWGERVTTCGITRNPDTNPPADRDHVFQLEGNILSPGVSISESTLNTTEDGSSTSYSIALLAPPDPGATVTVTPASGDVTEGTVSAALVFTNANWDVPQVVTVTPGASGDGNDGDVMYNITHSVSSTSIGGCYDGILAGSVSVTNQNIDGVATIIVDPTSGLVVDEDGTTTAMVTFSAGTAVTATDDISINLTNNSPSEVSLSAATVVLTALNSYTATVTITGVSDDVVENDLPFSITTEPAVSTQPQYSGVNPPNIAGTNLDTNVAEVLVAPNNSPLQTDENGMTDSIDYALSASPTSTVTLTIIPDDPSEASVMPNTLMFDNTNWNIPQTVTVTGLDDQIDDDTILYEITVEPTDSSDPFWNGISVPTVPGENADNGDVAGISVSPTSGLVTNESGTTDSFVVTFDTQPLFPGSFDIRSTDTTEGLVSLNLAGPYSETVNIPFNVGDWNNPRTVFVQGQNDDQADGSIIFTIATENIQSGDAKYDALNDADVEDVSVTNEDDVKTIGINLSVPSLDLDENSAPESFSVVLATEPIGGDVNLPITSDDTSEATVSPASLTFTSANWNVPQNVTVSPVLDGIIDGDETFDVIIGPAVGADYGGQSGSVSVTVRNVDSCGPMTLAGQIGQPILATGTPDCVFDLYKTNGDQDPASWTFLGTFTVGPDGTIDTGVLVEPDCFYLATETGTFNILTSLILGSVPTLSTYTLIGFSALMLWIALKKRREIQA